MKLIVFIAYLISLITNFIFVIILNLLNHLFKWIGYCVHGILVLFILISMYYTIKSTRKNIKNYYSITTYLSYTLFGSTGFYLGIFIYMFIKRLDMEVIYFYAFCIAIWSVFQYIVVSIINSYIQALFDRPEQNKEEPKVDQNLQEMMLK